MVGLLFIVGVISTGSVVLVGVGSAVLVAGWLVGVECGVGVTIAWGASAGGWAT